MSDDAVKNGSGLKEDELAGFEKKVDEARRQLKDANGELSELAKALEEVENLIHESKEKAFRFLDETHIRLQEIFDRVSYSYEQTKKEYSRLRESGIGIIEKHIDNVRQKKNELLKLGFEIDDAIRNFELPDKLLGMRQKEVLLFNGIEDSYSSAMLITSRIKNMDSKANLLGYEYAELSGKLYGFNNTLMIIGNTLDSRRPIPPEGAQPERYQSKFQVSKRGAQEYDHYIR